MTKPLRTAKPPKNRYRCVLCGLLGFERFFNRDNPLEIMRQEGSKYYHILQGDAEGIRELYRFQNLTSRKLVNLVDVFIQRGILEKDWVAAMLGIQTKMENKIKALEAPVMVRSSVISDSVEPSCVDARADSRAEVVVHVEN